MMTVDLAELEKKAESFKKRLPERLNGLEVSVEKSFSQVGGGSFPGHQIESRVIAFRGNPEASTRLERFFRTGKPAVMGRLSEGAYFLDVRTLFESDLSMIITRLNEWTQRSDLS